MLDCTNLFYANVIKEARINSFTFNDAMLQYLKLCIQYLGTTLFKHTKLKEIISSPISISIDLGHYLNNSTNNPYEDGYDLKFLINDFFKKL